MISVPVAVPRPLFLPCFVETFVEVPCGLLTLLLLTLVDRRLWTATCGELALLSTTNDRIKFSMVLTIRAQFLLSVSSYQLS